MASISASEAQTSGLRPQRGIKMAAWFASLAVAIAAMWFILQARESGNDPGTTPSNVARHLSSGGSAAGLVALTDRDAGFQLKYPEAWKEVQTGVHASAGARVIQISGQSAFSIQTFPLQHPVASSNINDMRAVTDAILSSPSAKLTVLDVRDIKVAGLPAIYYLYYFPFGKQRGIHAHYFIFDGARLDTLVFQVVPASKFADYADQFDQVVASFKAASH